jgi:hypothetical protein
MPLFVYLQPDYAEALCTLVAGRRPRPTAPGWFYYLYGEEYGPFGSYADAASVGALHLAAEVSVLRRGAPPEDVRPQ